MSLVLLFGLGAPRHQIQHLRSRASKPKEEQANSWNAREYGKSSNLAAIEMTIYKQENKC